jgi:hypothetical protein
MKAVRFERFGDPEVLQYVDVPDPLAATAQAHHRLENREVRGVIVLDPKIEAEATS